MDDQAAIVGEVVNRFYRPLMAQARWIDPQLLAHERTPAADSNARVDHERAFAIVEAIGLRRVCHLTDANERCRGLSGGVLRFSPAYAVGSSGLDSALVYARYTPIGYGAAGEIEFFVARTEGRWRLISRRDVPAVDASTVATAGDVESAMQALLAADRRFAEAAGAAGLAAAYGSMFVTNVVVNARTGMLRGRDTVIAELAASPDAGARATWQPVGGGIASDLRNGYTYGYMTVTRPDGSTHPGKYLAYWIREASGWRVAVYRRTPRPAGEPSLAMLPLSYPVSGLPEGDSATVARYADELSAAERAFSADAQPMGLGPAFAKWGAADAVNMGGPTAVEFVRGSEAIGRVVGSAPVGGSITWGPNEVIVASTGDLGVTIGTIRIVTPASDRMSAPTTADVPFFTIWRRRTPVDPWRYVAE